MASNTAYEIEDLPEIPEQPELEAWLAQWTHTVLPFDITAWLQDAL